VLGTGHTRAKFILLGEHSVVYGRPAIALPLPALSMTATLRSAPGPVRVSSSYYSGFLADAPASLAGPTAAIHAAATAFGMPLEGIEVHIDSAIPAERGLGSSAASAGAIVHAFADATGRRLTDDEHVELVQVAERIAHGTPSGLDAVATNSRVPILFRGGDAQTLSMALGATFVIADSGVRGRTRIAVADVRRLREATPAFVDARLDRLGSLVEGAVVDLAEDRAVDLGLKMSRAHAILGELSVSSRGLDGLVTAATDAGALGAKLTGGGQGGCVVALAQNPEDGAVVARALEAAGAVRTWTYDTLVPVA
jgi:mevalonate kinase